MMFISSHLPSKNPENWLGVSTPDMVDSDQRSFWTAVAHHTAITAWLEVYPVGWSPLGEPQKSLPDTSRHTAQELSIIPLAIVSQRYELPSSSTTTKTRKLEQYYAF